MQIVDNNDQRKRLLAIVSTVIAPWFTQPELLSDFLTTCYNAGGSMSLLALSGVFYLIKERNLDYPSFYPKLYSLLNRDILHSKHRSRFFRLLDTFLASTHLPAALVASFLKRLSRLTLNAPPSAIAFVVPWIYNMLKRHPLCTFMVHRETRDSEAKSRLQEQGVEDVFLPEEADPMETKAIESSLWELVQLQSHYHPNIATVAKIISEQFTKQSYNMEDFLDHSYASVRSNSLLSSLMIGSLLLTCWIVDRSRDGQGCKKGACCRVSHSQKGLSASRAAGTDPRQPDGEALGLWWCGSVNGVAHMRWVAVACIVSDDFVQMSAFFVSLKNSLAYRGGMGL